jgi:5-methylcytosine-specific restriction endonuclease McrA
MGGVWSEGFVPVIYESYKMLAPDGSHLCNVDSARADWYTRKGLATWETDKIFKLLFEPGGVGAQDDPYYMQNFKNQCVVCGSEENLTRHHVIPYCFRRFFPEKYKSHSHHDLLVVCDDCHHTYERMGDDLRQEVCLEYLGVAFHDLQRAANQNREIERAKRTLANYSHYMDDERRARIEAIAALPFNPDMKFDWAERVVQMLNEDYYPFTVRWREHFVKTMQPKFLPQRWDVKRPLDVRE